MLEDFIDDSPRERALGIVAPHAGYMYSGAVAGSVYSRIEIPSRAIILCPNHTGLGGPLSLMRAGAWKTPLGQMQIDTEMCDALMAADAFLEDDFRAHQMEHAIEVQLPFLQHLAGDSARFVPITIGTDNWDALEQLGQAMARTITQVDPAAVIIASSDMNHYENDAVTRVKDARAIDQMLQRNARGLYDTVRREKISMCGFGPAASMLVAANLLGATKSQLVRYATSADVSRDFARVVGYAGVIVT